MSSMMQRWVGRDDMWGWYGTCGWIAVIIEGRAKH